MPIIIERVKDRIWLKTTGGKSPELASRCQRIVGASYRRSSQAWTFPLDMITCGDLRGEFKAQLEIGPELARWAWGQRKKFEQLQGLLTARDAPLERVPTYAPVIWAAMNDASCMEVGCLGIGSKTHGGNHRVKSHTYQKPAALYAAIARRCQNASQPGLGKTIETLAGIIESGISGMILVAAPKTALRTVWEPEIQRWLPGVPVFVTTGGKGRRMSIIEEAQKTWTGGGHSLVFVVVNPEMLRTHTIRECGKDAECDPKSDYHKNARHRTLTWYEHDYPVLFERAWSAFVIDETHRYILKVNLRTQKATLAGTGAMLLPLAADSLKLALSGTPWKGKPRNAWSVSHWLHGDIGLDASFWNWAYRMLQVEDGEYGKVIGGIGDEKTFNRWTDGFMIRHTKAEMAPWLPPKTYAGSRLDPADLDSPIAVWLEMEGKQATAYKSMLDDAMARLDDGTLTATGTLAERTRLKQFANGHGNVKTRMVKGKPVQEFYPDLPSNKFDAMLQFLDERGITGDEDTEDGDSKVVIASQFTKIINVWAAEFERRGIRCYRITGEQGDAARMDAVRGFQEPGGIRVCLINTMAGGVAVTLDAADDLFFIDETDVPDDQEQVEDRTHRTSKIHNVTIYYLKTRGTVDELIARQNMDKDDIQKRLLDGKRGVELARKLLKGE